MYCIPPKVHSHLRQHQLFFGLALFVLIAAVFSFYLAYTQMQRKINIVFDQITERRSLAQLQIFHKGVELRFRGVLNEYALLIDRLAEDSQFRESLQKQDISAVKEVLDRERVSHEYVTGLNLVDKTGVVVAFASAFPGAESYIGSNIGSFENIQRTLEGKKSVVMNVPKSPAGRNVLSFTKPMMDVDGNIEYILSATVTLDTLEKYLVPRSHFIEFDVLLVDMLGRVLFSTDDTPIEQVSVVNDANIQRMLRGHSRGMESQTISYKGDKAFMEGSLLDLGQDRSMVLATYYPVSQSDAEAQNLKYQIDALFVRYIAQSIIVLIAFFFLLMWLIKRHEKVVHSQ